MLPQITLKFENDWSSSSDSIVLKLYHTSPEELIRTWLVDLTHRISDSAAIKG
jgi:hypothetical protein